MRTLTELTPIYDTRKSFYGKAKVERREENHSIYVSLYSYDTLVVTIKDNSLVFLWNEWNTSQTTLRHCKEFLKQNGFTAETKAQMEKDYTT